MSGYGTSILSSGNVLIRIAAVYQKADHNQASPFLALKKAGKKDFQVHKALIHENALIHGWNV